MKRKNSIRLFTTTQKDYELTIVAKEDATGEVAAGVLRDRINASARKPLTIFFATGSTPLPTYRRLVEMHERGELSFQNVHAFILDEYLGLAPDDPNTFANVMRTSLFDLVDLPPKNRHFLPTDSKDPEAACRRYELDIRNAGGINVIVLGIGSNGHIAFNEPGTARDSRTRPISLSDPTRLANARFFSSPDLVPTQALTIGIADILEARTAILIAAGAGKALAMQQALCGPVTADVPASFLQELRGELLVILDEKAAARLPYGTGTKADYNF